MKRKGLFITVLSTMLLGVGVFAGVSSVSENAPVEKAEATAAVISSYAKIYRFRKPVSDWGDNVYIHIWGSATESNNTSWPGIKLEEFYYNESSQKVYLFGTNVTDYQKVIFHNNSGWQTNDLPLSGGNTAWWLDSGKSPDSWTPTSYTFNFYDYEARFNGTIKFKGYNSEGGSFVSSLNGAEVQDIQNSSDHLFTFTLDEACDKCDVSDSNTTHTIWLNQNRGKTYCWWKDNDSWDGSLDYVRAHDWIYQTMHLRDIPTSNNKDTGACRGNSGYYQKAKTAYSSFSTSIRTYIQNEQGFNNARARFSAWAAANGETASINGTTLSISGAILVPETMMDSRSSIAAIVVSSAIAVVAASGFVFFKKKKSI